MGFPHGSVGKNLPAMQEAWVQSLGWEDPLEEGMAAHSSILAWRIRVNPGAWWATYSTWGRKESDTTERLSTALYDHFFYSPLRGKDRVYVSCFFFGHTSRHTELSWPGIKPVPLQWIGDQHGSSLYVIYFLIFDSILDYTTHRWQSLNAYWMDVLT